MANQLQIVPFRGDTMEIGYLCNYPQYINTVSRWIYEEFVIKSGSRMTLEKVNQYFRNTSANDFPITLVAISDNKCVGTVSLFENDLDTQDSLRPWLASLFVEPTCRGLGIAEKLINQLLKTAGNLGYEKLYLRTEHTSEYYRTRNWMSLGKTIDGKGQETEVFFRQTI